MKGFHVIALMISVAMPALASANENSGMIVTYHEPLQTAGFTRGDVAHAAKPGIAESLTVTFDALGRSFDLELESNDRLFASDAARARHPDIDVYRGRLAGNDDSWVRITVADGFPRGLIWDGSELYAIEAPGDSAVDAATAIIYRLSDTYIVPGTMSCGDGLAMTSGAAVYAKLTAELGGRRSQAPGASSQLNIGAIGDFDFASAKGAGADAAIITRFNNVDGIYSNDIGVQISVEELTVFSDAATDPFSSSTDPAVLLDEVGTYRQLTPGQVIQGLTHLYTGRDLDGTTVGLAYSSAGPGTGVLCDSRFGAGLSQGTFTATTDSLIAAHEIGHNFGAPHDGVPGSACEAEPQTFIMAPSVNGSDQFSQCSINIMQQSAAAAACVNPLPSTDMTIELAGQAPGALLGGTVTMNFDATNLGSQQADNVEVDITIPNNFSFVSASSTAGSCTNGAGAVNCQLGSVPGGTTSTVTLSTIANDTNSGTFVATVSADVDDDPSNNQETVVVTPLPAVDLAVSTTAASVTVNQGTVVRATLENRNSMDATNVTISIAIDAGLRADSASWPEGACTVTPQQVDCQANLIAGQSSSTLNLNVTGLTTGLRPYTVTMTSNENDANTNNNSATSNVNVMSGAGGGSEKSGGGAAGPALLLVLLSVLLIARAATGVNRPRAVRR